MSRSSRGYNKPIVYGSKPIVYGSSPRNNNNNAIIYGTKSRQRSNNNNSNNIYSNYNTTSTPGYITRRKRDSIERDIKSNSTINYNQQDNFNSDIEDHSLLYTAQPTLDNLQYLNNNNHNHNHNNNNNNNNNDNIIRPRKLVKMVKLDVYVPPDIHHSLETSDAKTESELFKGIMFIDAVLPFATSIKGTFNKEKEPIELEPGSDRPISEKKIRSGSTLTFEILDKK